MLTAVPVSGLLPRDPEPRLVMSKAEISPRRGVHGVTGTHQNHYGPNSRESLETLPAQRGLGRCDASCHVMSWVGPSREEETHVKT